MGRTGWGATALVLVASVAGCTATPTMIGSRLSPADSARFCAFAAACGMGGLAGCGTGTIEAIATGGSYAYDATWLVRGVGCSQTATDCESFRTCAALGHGSAYCASYPGRTCDGSVLVDCEGMPSEPQSATDCALDGQFCVPVIVGTMMSAVCTNGNACDPATTPDRCEGTAAITCDSSVAHESRTDCARLHPGGTCVIDSTFGDFRAICAPAGVACDPATSTTHCEDRGGTLVACVGGHQQRLDCSVVQGTCRVTGTDAECRPTATACVTDSPDRCEGNDYLTCVNGNYVSVDCTSLGFTTCVSELMSSHCM